MDAVPPDNAALEKRTYRKAWLRIIPLIALGYGIAYIDRVNISFASLQMNRDLNFSATVYGFGAGLFFLSYAACEVPSNLMLYRFGARRWLARIMVTWGVVAMAMVLVRTPTQFYIARFALGMAEAGFFPGVIFYLTQWFPPELRARSITGFYIAWPLSYVVMGIIAGGLMSLDGRLGLSGWQWLFAVEGLPAVILGLVFFILLPDSPATAAWLTDSERYTMLLRLRSRVSDDPSERPASIASTLRDSRVCLLGMFMFCMLACSYAYGFYAPAIVQKLTGLSITNTGFVIAAIYVVGAAAMLGNGILSDRTRRPLWGIIPGCLMMSGGFLALGLSMVPGVALTGLLAIIVAHMSLQGPLLALATSFLKGRAAAAGIAAMNTIGIVGAFVGPYWMGIAKDLTGNYQRGLVTMAVPMLIAAGILFFVLRKSGRMPGHLTVRPATS